MDQVDAGRPADAGVTFKDWPAGHDWRRFDGFMTRSIGQHAGHARRDIADLVAHHTREMEISLDRAELAWRRERMWAVFTMAMLRQATKQVGSAVLSDVELEERMFRAAAKVRANILLRAYGLAA